MKPDEKTRYQRRLENLRDILGDELADRLEATLDPDDPMPLVTLKTIVRAGVSHLESGFWKINSVGEGGAA